MIRLAVPEIGDAEVTAVERVLRSGMLVHGAEGRAFEQELAAYLDVPEVVVVSSGTAALHLALLALEIGPGDAVLVPDFTFPATANVVERIGARCVLVDVDPGTYNLTPAGLEAGISAYTGSERLRAVMPVHEFGCPADMDGIVTVARRHGLNVVEDAACALGATWNGQAVGSFGDAGCFSFHPRKALTTGEGGAIATRDPAFAAKLRRLRSHGIEAGPGGMAFLDAGLNYRLTDFQAALGRVQLTRFPAALAARRRLRDAYERALASLPVTRPADVPGHAWQTYMVVLPDGVDRDRAIAELKARGIETNLGAQAIHAQAYYQGRYPAACAALAGNGAERLFRQGLALPLHPGLADEDVATVARELGALVAVAVR